MDFQYVQYAICIRQVGFNLGLDCWKPKQITYIKHKFDIRDPLLQLLFPL